MKFKIGDTIKVTAGKDRGRTAKIQAVNPRQKQIKAEGINKYKKHLKARGEGKPGGIVDLERPLAVANVALICPTCKQATRVGYNLENPEKKTRICRKCKANI